jgi:two-component system, NarL family, sensor histidine kinase DevS
MLMTSKRAGTQVFTTADVKTVETLKAMCERIDGDRDAYDRGTRAERGRIARDLHDDVSSRLLTSLHRTEPERVQADVREALSDIRSIISGLEGDRQDMSDVISAIRIEAMDRLEAAGIEAFWPLEDKAPPLAMKLNYNVYRNLSAVMREITANIIRHSKATRVQVASKLTTKAGQPVFEFDIKDNGVGLDREHRNGSGLGNIVARMSEIGGNAAINTQTPPMSGDGTHLSLRLPLPPYSGGPRQEGERLNLTDKYQ